MAEFFWLRGNAFTGWTELPIVICLFIVKIYQIHNTQNKCRAVVEIKPLIKLMEMYEVQCPSCFELFSLTIDAVGSGESSEIDYDCEVCCHPMVIVMAEGGVFAKSLEDL